MIIPIIEVIQTYLFVSCFLKRKVRFGKVLDWLVLIGVSEVGTIGNHYFQDANINILIAVIELFILLSFFDGWGEEENSGWTALFSLCIFS